MTSKLDRQVLKGLQDDFPVESRPFASAGARFGLSESRLIRRLKKLRRTGHIRYLGAVWENGKLGIRSTLVAMRVDKKYIKRTVKVINSYPQVSHNYLRRGEFNIWFTLSAGSRASLSRLINEIKRKTGIKEVINLETVKVFKIDARFNFKN